VHQVVLVQITTTVTLVVMVEQVVVDRFKRMVELAVVIPTVWDFGLVVPEAKVILVVVLQRYERTVRHMHPWVRLQPGQQALVVQVK
jgi:hypothetical protein